eukprot:4026956-Ditylum_brightwellii.AAC.1
MTIFVVVIVAVDAAWSKPIVLINVVVIMLVVPIVSVFVVVSMGAIVSVVIIVVVVAIVIDCSLHRLKASVVCGELLEVSEVEVGFSHLILPNSWACFLQDNAFICIRDWNRVNIVDVWAVLNKAVQLLKSAIKVFNGHIFWLVELPQPLNDVEGDGFLHKSTEL